MWHWAFIFLAPFFVLFLIEELTHTGVNRYINGPSRLESKLKEVMNRLIKKAPAIKFWSRE